MMRPTWLLVVVVVVGLSLPTPAHPKAGAKPVRVVSKDRRLSALQPPGRGRCLTPPVAGSDGFSQSDVICERLRADGELLLRLELIEQKYPAGKVQLIYLRKPAPAKGHSWRSSKGRAKGHAATLVRYDYPIRKGLRYRDERRVVVLGERVVTWRAVGPKRFFARHGRRLLKSWIRASTAAALKRPAKPDK